MKPKVIVIVVVVILALIILLQNAHPTVFRLLFWRFEMSQVVLVLLCLAIGFILGSVVTNLGRGRPKDQD